MPRNYEAEDGGRREAWWMHVLSLVRCESAMLCDCATGVLKLVCRRRERRRERTGGARAVTSSWANPPARTGNSLRTLGLSLCVSYRPRSLRISHRAGRTCCVCINDGIEARRFICMYVSHLQRFTGSSVAVQCARFMVYGSHMYVRIPRIGEQSGCRGIGLYYQGLGMD